MMLTPETKISMWLFYRFGSEPTIADQANCVTTWGAFCEANPECDLDEYAEGLEKRGVVVVNEGASGYCKVMINQ